LESLGHTSKFQRISRLGFITAPTSVNGGQPNFAQCLAISWDGIFWGALSPERILPAAKFTLGPSLAFSYIGNITARHLSSGRQPNFATWYNEWNYRTFAAESAIYIRHGGHHMGHRPTFYLVFSVLLALHLFVECHLALNVALNSD